MTDLNKCDCGWQETPGSDEFSPHRQKCPNCGAPFFEREEIRWFMKTGPYGTETDRTEESDQR